MNQEHLQQLKHAANANRRGRSTDDIPPREFINIRTRDFVELVDAAAAATESKPAESKPAENKPAGNKPAK